MREWLQRQSALLLTGEIGVITLGIYLLFRTKSQALQAKSSIPAYSYESFQDASRDTRLILIPKRRASQDSGEKVYHRYRLQTFSVKSAPPFEAISYTWGSGPHNRQSTCRIESVLTADQTCHTRHYKLVRRSVTFCIVETQQAVRLIDGSESIQFVSIRRTTRRKSYKYR
jgi:hypothetical protein